MDLSWFGNATDSLSKLATSATPIATAFSGRGTRPPVANASPDQTSESADTPTAGVSVKMILLIVVGLVVLGGGVMLFLNFRK
jgi:hypothetical protein